MSKRPSWERCPQCKRHVALPLVFNGLGRRWVEEVPLEHGDSFRRSRYEHTFPCKGRSLRPDDMLREYAALLRERNGTAPAGYEPPRRTRKRTRRLPDQAAPNAPLPGEAFRLDKNADDRPDDPGYAADAWKRA